MGWMLVHFEPTIAYAGMMVDTIGWVLLVSGQSVVLYSRLHLVLDNSSILRAVLWMIICNGVVWHTSITVLLFGSTYSPSQSRSGFSAVYNVMEKVQMTFFCLQEFIISGLYIWATVDILRIALGNKRRFMWQLFSINVLIMIMDVALLAVEYKGYFVWEQGLKVVIYSVKLKLELAVLGELVKFVQHHGDANSRSTLRCQMTGPMESSFVWPQRNEKEIRAASKPESTHVEASQINTAVSVRSNCPSTIVPPESKRTTDVKDGSLDLWEDRSALQLYDDLVRQISRS